MRVVSKRVFQTVNSNGDQRTIVNIVNRRNSEMYRTQAVSNKKDPSKFEVVQQKIERVGNKVVAQEKKYKMKEKDIMKLFMSANESPNITMKSVEDKKKVSTKKTKKTTSTKKIKMKKTTKPIKKTKKMKGGSDDAMVKGLDPHRYGDMAPFQTLEQERGQMKGGNRVIPLQELQNRLSADFLGRPLHRPEGFVKGDIQNATKVAIDSVTLGTPFKVSGGKKK